MRGGSQAACSIPATKFWRCRRGFRSRVQSVDTFEGALDEAFAPMSVTLTLEDEIDISRGDMIVAAEDPPQVSQDVDIMVCWLGEKSPWCRTASTR